MKRALHSGLLVAAAVAMVYFAAVGSTSALAQQDGDVLLAQLDAGEEASQTETAELVEDPDGDQQFYGIGKCRYKSSQRKDGQTSCKYLFSAVNIADFAHRYQKHGHGQQISRSHPAESHRICRKFSLYGR